MSSRLLETVVAAVQRLPAGVVEELARGALSGSASGLLDAVPDAGVRRAAEAIVDAWRVDPGVTAGEIAAMLRAATAAWDLGEHEGRAEVVMTGPGADDAPTRSTEAVVLELVTAARHDLLLVTYAAFPYPPLMAGLTAARERRVRVRVVVETVAGAKGLLHSEPAAVFAAVPGIELFHWPVERRSGPVRGRLHAKLVVADREIAFVTSANLTGSAIESNLECGLLVRGGAAPRRLADHFAALIRDGILEPLTGDVVHPADGR
jgi:phosphatidylserine/phosphatidylglycerophosphate/cardiolipin synthase-like enzyme